MLKVSPVDIVHFGHRNQKVWDVSNLKASFLPSSFHCTRGAVQAARGVDKSMVLLIFDTYEPQQWPAWKDSPKGILVLLISARNQQLSNYTEGPLNWREIMPGTRNIANYLGLVESWILKEKPVMKLY